MNKDQLKAFRHDLEMRAQATLNVIDHLLKWWDHWDQYPESGMAPTLRAATPDLADLNRKIEREVAAAAKDQGEVPPLVTPPSSKEDPLAEGQVTTGGIVKPTPTRKPGRQRASSPRAGSGAERVREWASQQAAPFTMRDAKQALSLSHSTVTCAFLRLVREGALKRQDHGTYARVQVAVAPPKAVAKDYAKFRESLGELKVPSAGSLCPESRGEA